MTHELFARHHLSREVVTGIHPEFLCPLPVSEEIRRDLVVLFPDYCTVLQTTRTGMIVVHRAIARKVLAGFQALHRGCFPIGRMLPIVAYNWSDVRSMAANNTSGFNYRYISGTDRLSLHAYGLAFDLNPLWNPCCGDGLWSPDAPYVPDAPGTITRESWVVRVFEDLGFKWGGDWSEPFDPQHFQMPLSKI